MQNPFSTSIFKSIWLKHFNSKKAKVKSFNFISGLDFLKNGNKLFYYNVGKTHTKGLNYKINSTEDVSLNNKAVVIYDVPTYFEVDTTELGSKIKLLKSKQYPGYLIETGKYESLKDYMLENFSKNSRNKNNKFKRRLEDSFNIRYQMFIGEMSKSEYDFIFKSFKELLEKRFADKQITNNNLEDQEWSFYYDVAYPLILEKKASLFVIYDNEKPIGVTLCYFSEDILFDAITVFDIDYFKFHLGSVTIMKLIEWCIDNEIRILDFSKGYFEYKTRWCTKQYDFEYHIYYDSKSEKSKLLANSIKRLYDIKQRLREKNINDRLHKLTYKLKNKEEVKTEKLVYKFEEAVLNETEQNLKPINFELPENKTLKLMVFEYLYLYLENYNNIQLFEMNNETNSYLIKGKQKSFIATAV
ncbi:GNAT family N-acetyltransferase [Winogradskyella litoriviva]|uniref:GNAT family N-acetyltransferase n=1 Tax=Winogradskyella litoriviva TaxID=1220182 RepID=A0ABX2E981_9FLAO|nr:GNAT family N-acetyltransferase [Winogradskyella litoriviva]NRD24698.1 GNAT family N-acetyltransferase [Winogradskyella litoriviva]